MKIIKVNLKGQSYNIIVGRGIVNLLGKQLLKLKLGKDTYVITNNKIKNKFGKLIAKALLKYGFNVIFRSVPDSEKSKSIETATAIIKDLARSDLKKKVFIIALGGGVIGDLSGFVASIYKRGIPYVQVPTTMLAQVDSAIGGKTAVDLAEGKNLVGAFYQPDLVFSDVELLKSLPLRQIRSGLAEVIKYGVIIDEELFSYVQNKVNALLKLEPRALEHIVTRCSQIKADIVSRDEKEEKGLRTILNFGHTVGHAIEAAEKFSGYNHGEAIALGMLVASGISRRLNLIDSSHVKRIESLLEDVGLPLRIKRVGLRAIINAHFHDKKFIGKTNRFVLLRSIGRSKIVRDIPQDIIEAAIKERL